MPTAFQPDSDNARNIFTVTKLNRLVRTILEAEIGLIWVSAEISNFVAASSGHWYFTLKDNRAQVKAAMFRGANRRVLQQPKEGDKVLVRANLSLYEPRGDYQLIVEHLEGAGEGLLKQAFEKLKIQLSQEGLFADLHKQPLPSPIRKVGVITSSTGAALHDILTVLKRRNPGLEVIVYPSLVQGDEAPAQLVQALQTANRRAEVDVLIFGRGGGSLEDLWCFNDEKVARAIFASKLPIISAVGHEIDVTISDFVADLRAPTPSAAAELVSQDQRQLLESVQQRLRQLSRSAQQYLTSRHYQQQRLSDALARQHPQYRLREQQQRLDFLSARLKHLCQQRLGNHRRNIDALTAKLAQQSPERQVQQQQQRLLHLQQQLRRRIREVLARKGQQLANASHLLDTVSPLATLGRGYSISFVEGQLLRSGQQTQVGDKLTTRLADAELQSTVTAVQAKD